MITDRLLFGIVHRIVFDEMLKGPLTHETQGGHWTYIRRPEDIWDFLLMSFVRRTYDFCTGGGASCQVNCVMCAFQRYTCKHNREHQLTVACYVSNIMMMNCFCGYSWPVGISSRDHFQRFIHSFIYLTSVRKMICRKLQLYFLINTNLK